MKHILRVLLMLVVLAAILAGYIFWIEPNWIDVARHDLTVPSLPAEFEGYTIVQISDIHIDKREAGAYLRNAFKRINREKPDLIVITGDFVSSSSSPYFDDLDGLLSTLSARDGVLAVLGNHDCWVGAGMVRDILDQAGVKDLTNDIFWARRGDALLPIAGLDDGFSGFPDLEGVAEQIPEALSAVVLIHEPDWADTIAPTGHFFLQLSGHSHGGQIVLPGMRPFILPWLAQKYYSGFNQVGDMQVYTNRGLGANHFHMRFNCRPEIAVFTLHALP